MEILGGTSLEATRWLRAELVNHDDIDKSTLGPRKWICNR